MRGKHRLRVLKSRMAWEISGPNEKGEKTAE
jgi:hypothetical protein